MTVLGVDVGGTFTDLAAIVDGRVVTAKVPSTRFRMAQRADVPLRRAVPVTER